MLHKGEREMKRKVKKSICSIVLSLLMMSSFTIEALAASQQDNNEEVVQLQSEVEQLDCEVSGYNVEYEIVPYATTFVDASITIYFESDGMHIDICTGMNDVASVVGVKDIQIQRKTGWFTYETVAVSSGGESYDVTTSLCTILYSNAVEGETYRVKCVHYGNVDGYRELEAETDWITCVIE